MGGWKTWTSAIAIGILGIVDIAGSVTGDDAGGIETGIAKILAALGLVGIGHKVEKNR